MKYVVKIQQLVLLLLLTTRLTGNTHNGHYPYFHGAGTVQRFAEVAEGRSKSLVGPRDD